MDGAFGDTQWVPTSLLNNSTVHTPQNHQELKTVPFDDKEELVLGGTYLDQGDAICIMVKAVPEESQEYFLGYRFISDRHVYYRANGATTDTYDPWALPDDIVARVTSVLSPFVYKDNVLEMKFRFEPISPENRH